MQDEIRAAFIGILMSLPGEGKRTVGRPLSGDQSALLTVCSWPVAAVPRMSTCDTEAKFGFGFTLPETGHSPSSATRSRRPGCNFAFLKAAVPLYHAPVTQSNSQL